MSSVNNEITFPVPWGAIAAKTWGDPCSKPVLVVHGIQDNAGSFDRLIPLLPKVFYYVCIDLPGHGLSTRFPKGIRLDFMLYVSAVNRVVRQLGWKNFYYLGHSLGGQLGWYYAAMYPEQIIKLVVLDVVPPARGGTESILEQYKDTADKMIELENKMQDSTPPNYTYESALDRLIKSRPNPITRAGAERLLIRCLKEGKNGYYYTTDQRLKFYVTTPMSKPQHIKNLQRVNAPLLYIMTNVMRRALESDEHSVAAQALNMFKQKANCKLVFVDGYHDVHNDQPDVVAPYVTEFFTKEKSNL